MKIIYLKESIKIHVQTYRISKDMSDKLSSEIHVKNFNIILTLNSYMIHGYLSNKSIKR